MVANAKRHEDERECAQKRKREVLDLVCTKAVAGCDRMAGDEEERRRRVRVNDEEGVSVELRR